MGRLKLFAALFLFVGCGTISAQTNIICTSPLAEQVMLGNYNPASFTASTIISQPDSLSQYLLHHISPDSLKGYLLDLKAFHTRNTGSDTVSNNNGIGASRRWAYSKFQQFSATADSRLIPFYLQFDRLICNAPQHKNICAVLPGADTTDKSIIIVEGHIDSRCEMECDTAGLAQGMEDNASGTALVLELARVMSRFTLNRTVVFVLTIAEEQGLYGAEALADYTQQKGIKVKAVLNNDIVGGIICGHTSSAPSCPGVDDIDSTHVRLFSYGGFNSKHKQLSRFIKLEYKEQLMPFATVPMSVQIMTPEDRMNRGGDHIPFRQHNYPAMRFTSANEHGDANVDSTYIDRQHSSRDVLGVDTNGDNTVDSFYVDFDYLGRNTLINGNAIAMAAIGPATPTFIADTVPGNKIRVEIQNEFLYSQYRVGIRSATNDWDSVYYMIGEMVDTIALCDTGTYYVSVATMDYKNVESLFSNEVMVQLRDSSSCVYSGINDGEQLGTGIELMQNRPNPFDEATTISVFVKQEIAYKECYISIAGLDGKELQRIPVMLKKGMNEVLYRHGYHAVGINFYSLVVDGKVVQTKRMVFAN